MLHDFEGYCNFKDLKYEIYNLLLPQTEASVPQRLTQVTVLVMFWNDLPQLPS